MQQNQSSTRHGVNSDDETVTTSKVRGNKSDDTVTSKALTHKIEKRRRDDEEEGEELLQSETRSKRTVRQPPKVDEIYSYEHMKFIYQRNKNKEVKDAKRDNDAKKAKEVADKEREEWLDMKSAEYQDRGSKTREAVVHQARW
jgi:hypothetical protein